MVRIIYLSGNREIIFYSSSTSLQDTKQRENISLKRVLKDDTNPFPGNT